MNIALALSGGGHRAAAFHLGVLKYLSEKNLLESIDVVSSTSGGSILAAQLFHFAEKKFSPPDVTESLKWPSSKAFLDSALKQAEDLIVEENLEKHFIRRIFKFQNWMRVGHRANIMAEVMSDRWKLSGTIKDLPPKPNWIINGATNITGSRWFVRKTDKGCKMGSLDIGTADAENFPIADAAAISAAYPGVIGPYRLDSKKYQWSFNADSEFNQHLMKSHKGLYLSDGGLYDNLGIEPLFNIETNSLKFSNTNFLVVSDAGSGIKQQRLAPVWRPILRTLRLINVISQQVRDLRLRTLFSFFNANPQKGVYIPIGNSFSQWRAQRLKQGQTVPEILKDYEFLSDGDVLKAKNTKTSLANLSQDQCQLLIRHGFESAMIRFSVAEL